MWLSIKAHLIYRAFTSVGDYSVFVIGHMWQEELTSHSVIHVTLVGVSRQSGIVYQVEEVWSEQIWYHSLYGLVQ